MLSRREAQQYPAMCAHILEDQPYPGLPQKKHGQQVKGANSVPPPCSGETPLGFLHPVLEPSAQERHGAVEAGPEEGHKVYQRTGTPLLPRQAERAGVVHPGEHKPVGRPYSSLLVPEGGL